MEQKQELEQETRLDKRAPLRLLSLSLNLPGPLQKPSTGSRCRCARELFLFRGGLTLCPIIACCGGEILAPLQYGGSPWLEIIMADSSCKREWTRVIVRVERTKFSDLVMS